MTDPRIEAAREAISGATPGPWALWRGPRYVGGGEDICLGAGETWLANMDHRANYDPREHGEYGAWPGWLQLTETDILTIDAPEITAEQLANAQQAALSPALHAALDLAAATVQTVDELKKLNLPAGVDITIKI